MPKNRKSNTVPPSLFSLLDKFSLSSFAGICSADQASSRFLRSQTLVFHHYNKLCRWTKSFSNEKKNTWFFWRLVICTLDLTTDASSEVSDSILWNHTRLGIVFSLPSHRISELVYQTFVQRLSTSVMAARQTPWCADNGRARRWQTPEAILRDSVIACLKSRNGQQFTLSVHRAADRRCYERVS